jgi:hypothetical protein
MSSTESLAKFIREDKLLVDLASIQASLDAINSRLDRIESASVNSHSTIQNPQLTHPSLEKFSIAEAIADQIFAGKEKACTFEPDGKPCDHCSMCSSRGF